MRSLPWQPKRADKPGSVFLAQRAGEAIIYLEPRLPPVSSSLPGLERYGPYRARRSGTRACLTLLPVGVAWPAMSPRPPVVSYTTFSPSPTLCVGCLLFCGPFPSGFPDLGVTQHHALWSPDFPHPLGMRPPGPLRCQDNCSTDVLTVKNRCTVCRMVWASSLAPLGISKQFKRETALECPDRPHTREQGIRPGLTTCTSRAEGLPAGAERPRTAANALLLRSVVAKRQYATMVLKLYVGRSWRPECSHWDATGS